MRAATTIFLLVALTSFGRAQVTACAESNVEIPLLAVTVRDTAELKAGGSHSVTVPSVLKCIYRHTTTGLPDCDTVCSISHQNGPQTISISESANLLLEGIEGRHDVSWSFNDGASVAVGGGTRCVAGMRGSAIRGKTRIWESAWIFLPGACPAIPDPENQQPANSPLSSDPCLDQKTNTPGCSPLMIDLTGKGIVLTPARFGVFFDLKGKGTKSLVGWTLAGEDAQGFLALDRNGNGKIDDGTELFGNFSPQPSSATPNGFAALAIYDLPENGGNADGLISPADAIWPKLRVWVDYNHDGISQAEELKPLDFWNVAAIDLKYSESKHSDIGGNTFRYRAKILSSTPKVGDRWAWDVSLTVLADHSPGFN
jgi:hypothetical protein